MTDLGLRAAKVPNAVRDIGTPVEIEKALISFHLSILCLYCALEF